MLQGGRKLLPGRGDVLEEKGLRMEAMEAGCRCRWTECRRVLEESKLETDPRVLAMRAEDLPPREAQAARGRCEGSEAGAGQGHSALGITSPSPGDLSIKAIASPPTCPTGWSGERTLASQGCGLKAGLHRDPHCTHTRKEQPGPAPPGNPERVCRGRPWAC